MRGPDWTSDVEHVGLTANGQKVHLVYFNRYGVPLTVCKSLEVDHAMREDADPVPWTFEVPRCGPCWRYR